MSESDEGETLGSEDLVCAKPSKSERCFSEELSVQNPKLEETQSSSHDSDQYLSKPKYVKRSVGRRGKSPRTAGAQSQRQGD